MSDDVAVLFANEAFYTAFATRDFAAMSEMWARKVPVSCIHPGWAALSGRAAVMDSWRAILASPQAPRIAHSRASARVLGDLALVVCYENLPEVLLVATNIFVREDQQWRMIHHQAGASQAPSGPAEEVPPRLQ